MATGDVKRKLTAIFSADVEGYSRLMEEDELATVETLTSHKEIMRKMIRQYRGRVVDSTGDNLLAEFASVVDAVQCAVEVQQILSAKNEALPKNRRMKFRIGINSGDVIEEGELIYGDGVNVAARVESLAEGGGISISGTAFDQLGKKLPLGYKYLGEQRVKNIEKPVRVYRVLTEEEAVGKVIGEEKRKSAPWSWPAAAIAIVILAVAALAIWNFYFRPAFEPASEEKMAFPLSDKPSIAVLPFVNMSDDPKQELFSDGLAQNIITQLTKIPEMVVIAQTSSFKYKGKSVSVQQVGRELGVRYVLEGSVLKAGKQLRVTAQLIDANTGAHLWAQAYDRQLEGFFQVQDEITLKVVNALQVKLTEGTKDHIFKARTKNLKAHTTFIESYKLWEKFNREDNERAKKVMVKAIALDPDYSVSHSGMAWIYLMEYFYGWSKDPKRSLQMVEEFAKKAIALDDTEPTSHAALAQFYSQKGQFDLAIKEMERALELAPSDAGMVSQYGESRYWIGEYEEGLKMMKKAMVLRPFPPPFYLARLGMGYYLTEQYEQAATVLTSSSKKYPRQNRIRIWLIPTLVALGREKEARDEAEKLLEIDPKFSAKKWANRYFAPYKDPKVKERILEQYAKAGLS